jgi:hypothetical protein
MTTSDSPSSWTRSARSVRSQIRRHPRGRPETPKGQFEWQLVADTRIGLRVAAARA